MAKASAKAQILGRADSQYQAVLQQMNTENALQESMRQFDVLHGGGVGITDDEGTPTRTGITLGSVMGENSTLQGIGFYPNDEIFFMGGKYYIRKGENYVDMTRYIKPVMKNLPPLN